MNYDDKISYASDTFFVRFFWKTVRPTQGHYLQLTISRIAYTQLMSDLDSGIAGVFYKILDANKRVHRINKYDIRNVVAWETKDGRTDSGLRLT